MKKISFPPGTMMNPVPVVMVSCGDADKRNILTAAWTGIVNSNPPFTYVAIRKERHSHSIIRETGEFVINLCTEELAFAADYCGVKSGRDVDKFREQKLTPAPCEKLSCPSIGESPVSLECRVIEVHEYPSHDMFVGEIINVQVEEELLDPSGRIRLDRARLIAYNHGEYFPLGRQPIGRFGFSVMKPRTRKRLAAQKKTKK